MAWRVQRGGPRGSPTQHFLRFSARDHGLRLERETEDLVPFWVHLPDRGRHTLAVDVPQVHPHPLSRADELCCWAAWAPPHRTAASSLRVRRELGSMGGSDPREFDHEPTPDDERRFSAEMCRRVAERLERVGPVATRRSVSCIGVHELHGTAHVLGHHWLVDHPHRPWPAQPELVTSVYESVDRSLDRLVGDPAVNVVVLASQGFTPANSHSAALDGLLERAGLAVAPSAHDGASPAPARLDPMALLRRWLSPELRERIATSVLPASVQERLMADRHREAYDWHRTRVFALPTWTTGALRVNLAGREALGLVEPDDYAQLLTEVSDLVHDLRCARTGDRLVTRVVRMREEFPGRRADDLPDLAVEWAGDRPTQEIAHPRFGTWQADNDYHRHRWCEHHGQAVGYLAGPGIDAGGSDVVQVDMNGAAATFLRLAGARPPSWMKPAWDEVLR